MKNARRDKLVNALIVSLTFAFVVILCEFVFDFLNQHRNKQYAIRRIAPMKEPHPVLGYQLVRDQQFSESSYIMDDGKPRDVYNVVYTLDSHRRRYTPVQHPEERQKFIMVWGCSMVFGIGVEDNETLPARLGVYAPAYMPYNYGMPAGATQHYYHLLSENTLSQELDSANGISLFVYYDFHLNRIIGGMPEYNLFLKRNAAYILDEKYSLLFKGNFQQAFPLRGLLYDILYGSATLRYFHFFLPLRYCDSHYDLATSFFTESAKLFYQQFPDSRFVVIIGHAPITGEAITKRLKTAGIEVLEMKDFMLRVFNDERQWNIEGDGHGVPWFYDEFAKELADKLGLR